ncbi:ADP-ribose pyrophosphatase of COG1058 family / Nicotinamide-nucleotide amidase [hydrothermal vent metagenome]|uniref:ADP-ribose pyrophosphatase of COG1058 family / Nicotinamide-nucleotide amidase n=1 Tax=hydrothermal vent metagenome TaxID=652676 RepID=A0A3B0VAC3_9ZZZZ
MHTTAHIITIGDEILYGQITDTNAQWMSKELDAIGIKIIQRLTIGDVKEEILATLKYAEEKADIILITGGLGPTEDDLTKPCLAEYFGVDTKLNNEALIHLTALFKRFKFELTPTNKLQAHLPTNCLMLPNKLGTAPGMWFFENNTVFVSMPGVPYEMKSLMTNFVLPKLKEQFELPVIYHKVVRTIGIGESWLADKIKPWVDALPSSISLAYLPSLREVKLRLTTAGKNLKTLKKEVDKQIDELKKYAGKYIYGYDSDNIQLVVGQLLASKNQSIATAESCTGGYLAHLITSVPGSSAYYKGSIISYTKEIKQKELGVKSSTLEAYGVVSEQTAIEMAEGIRNKFGTTYGIATTGVAGPGGGTKEKPVGTVWIALATPTGTQAKLLSLAKDRMLNIEASSKSALAFAWQTFVQNT